jgi:hypothetical protein
MAQLSYRRFSAPVPLTAWFRSRRTPPLGAHQPLAPIEHGRIGAIRIGELGGVRFDLIAAIRFSFTIGG